MNTESDTSSPGSQPGFLPSFARLPGETPRAFGAFLAFFQLITGLIEATYTFGLLSVDIPPEIIFAPSLTDSSIHP